jgi:hypothetical protein
VQAARHLVASAAELSAGVQGREDERDGGHLLDRVLVDGDAAAVVDDPHTTVGLQRHLDVAGVPGESLVDGVVDDLVDQVVEAALSRGTDVHAGSFADRFQTLQQLNVAGVVGGIVGSGRCWIRRLGHQSSIRGVMCVSALVGLCRST